MKSETERESLIKQTKPSQPRIGWLYDLLMWICLVVTDIFFREVKFTGTYNIPSSGPAIIVIAPHANQFLDAALTMLALKKTVNRPLHFVEAAASLKRKVIGNFSRMSGAIPVERAQDLLVLQPGRICVDENDACLIRGQGTKFTSCCEPKGLVGLPHGAGSSKIQEVISDTELRLFKPFKGERAANMLASGTTYKIAPKVDTSSVFKAVFEQLHQNGVIGISPEGGSHDRTDLLPLKPGVAVMALGAIGSDPNCRVRVIPCGMNYFHPHKFRSRAVLEFGTPIVVTPEDGRKYNQNPRESVSKFLETLTDAMKTVTVTCPDYETLMIIQAARRLYNYPIKPAPLGVVLDMNRRLIIGYTKFKDEPRIVHLKDSVLKYNAKLEQLGIRDHQVEVARIGKLRVFARLIHRLLSIIVLGTLSLPGTLLFSPVFIAARVISHKKQREALANSVVKIKAIDVLGSWKVLVAMVVAPLLYFSYSLTGTMLLKRYVLIPVISKMHALVIFCLLWAVLVCTTYAAFRIGEVGMDICKSIKPLFYALGPKQNMLSEIQGERRRLSLEVTEVCNDLGPKVFPDFNKLIQKAIKHERDAREELEDDEEEREGQEDISLVSMRSSGSLNSMFTNGPSPISSVGPLESFSDIAIFSEMPVEKSRRFQSSSEESVEDPISTKITQAVVEKNRIREE